jgi:hypothetical protein
MPSTIDSTSFTGTSNNALFLGGVAANAYLLIANTITANNLSITGTLTLSSAPTANLEAATKQYVDSALSTVGDTWTIKTANYTAVNKDCIFADTSNTSFSITLPSTPANNAVVKIADARGTFDWKPLTIKGNNNQIMSDSSDLFLDVKNAALTFVYLSSLGWRIV